MKTLDEVIKALDVCSTGKGCENCPYAVYDEDGFEEYLECGKMNVDALYYLKTYKDDKDDLTALRAYWKEQHENNALTWDELKRESGKKKTK